MPLELLAPEELPDEVPEAATGLRHNVLSPLETLSQSVSAIAPTTTPALTVPLVFALAGNGAWLAYLLASAATLLIALCIARFARASASPGSLYKYATDSLPPIAGRTAGWALLLAYTSTGASVVGGFIDYARVLIPGIVPAAHSALANPILALLATAAATFLAYRDVQASARLMLWIEAASVSMIALVAAALLLRNGPHIDAPQLALQAVTPSGVRLGIVLALFSFVGFESATTLGHEAKNPLRAIPRAVIQSAILAGVFFLVCCYAETMGFRQLHQDLGASQAPFRALSALVRIPILGPYLGVAIDIAAFISMFACALACIVAGARVLLKMAQDGLLPQRLAATHARNETPHLAVLAIGLAVAMLSAGLALSLAVRGVPAADIAGQIYAQMGSLAVNGFITTYGLVAAALPIYLRRNGQLTAATLTVACAAVLAMLLAMAGTLYPVPPSPYNVLPYLYLAYLALGLAWFTLRRRSAGSTSAISD
jgi:amino acid transporter